MKFSATALAIFLLPIVSLASPVPEPIAEGAVAMVSDEGIDFSEKRSDGEIFSRANTLCSIINVSTTVNCRTGPGTSYPAPYYATNGQTFVFSCYKRGTCVSGNCTWDYVPAYGCYISGYYTSAACSIANLGAC
ncbi:hypothetical protein V495_03398 [Pseudogymnoascus sp. VKM F-4514 (FW-929)]|nr:hypothetical protein V490_05147 [Pseudogymnoascus sp. VKM F-3557]KFY44531.1 hypothetical protein V495_03398 [Pseudogymnoascus sp. VKM F-4514 (FW-929)]KFY58915.1 hypothetical protein V497_04631 [Pseudogymnoascus sp. VKM F-4516 (FW-969)]